MRCMAVWLGFFLCSPGLGAAGVYSDAGSAAATFLNIGAGSRSLAMGGAGVAAAGGPNVIWLNPAQLARQEAGGGSFTHGAYLEDTAVEQLALSVITPQGSFAAGLSAFRAGDIESYSSSGASLGTFSPLDIAVSGAFAYPMGKLALGAMASYLRSELASDATAAGFSVDVGAGYAVDERIDVGAAVQHIGTSLKYDRESTPLPLTVRGGASYRLADYGVLAVADAVKALDENVAVRLGAEKRVKAGPLLTVNLRAGWRSGTPGGDISGVSGGAGVIWSPETDFLSYRSQASRAGDRIFGHPRFSGLCIDYAWTPMGELGQAHWFSFALMF